VTDQQQQPTIDVIALFIDLIEEADTAYYQENACYNESQEDWDFEWVSRAAKHEGFTQEESSSILQWIEDNQVIADHVNPVNWYRETFDRKTRTIRRHEE
jgi:hypothetical protein